MDKRSSVSRRPSTAKEAKVSVTASRRLAFEILMLVRAGRGHSDELLHSSRLESLRQEDKNFTTALVMGVLRWQIALDAKLRGLLDRPGQRLAEEVSVVLEMGAYQLLHMDRVPAHAALSESVELCRAANQPHAAGMVNAVLRKLATPARKGASIFESPAVFAERLGHPEWMVGRWTAAYGWGAALKICEAGQEEPQHGRLFGGTDAELPVMDDGSRLVAELAVAAMPAAARVWDACAAPGGKAMVLAQRLGGADVLASDISAKRVARMESRVRQFDYAARVKCAVVDAAEAPGLNEEFDLILCDVPCGGTGTLAENPEIRHRLRPEDLARQAARQRAILEGALSHLAPGGRLVYSTCSLEAEECDAVVDTVMSSGAWRRLPVQRLLEGLKASGVLPVDCEVDSMVRNGDLRTLPGVHPCAGFFASVLERN